MVVQQRLGRIVPIFISKCMRIHVPDMNECNKFACSADQTLRVKLVAMQYLPLQVTP